ncbi:MAG TPA: putative peptide modification system cyclase [Lysobacter sp.]
MNQMTHRPSIEAPQLRTLLLTDLCDSTSLVERIGDVEAATLFRDHDRLVLDLQQRWRGRLIDRSDGMLLLFERPIDGLGFALDYVRGLREMGATRRLDLKARAGLHVGEVLTWRNSEEAVKVGAKPVEVEGLAKPMAARLMAMARPGQILLSAVAEPLAHRAARELGERGQHLLWKSHGRWRFKGLPDSQQIYEVGEPGIAPLRAPPNTPKAWRDIPLWRRPAALAAEAAVIAGIGVGVWFATRPAPAIAFNQRDWVVVADLRNLTGQSVLDDSLEQAFRISLEQSRYVNVLSDLKARDTLARMQLKPDSVIDRAIGAEIALRDGARAVILPTVAEVGGEVRVSAEVIDPHTQTTVFIESADGSGLESTLTSIDQVTASLRGKLGEAVKSIERDSEPLPKVTTRNLDALRAYAMGQKAYAAGQKREALGFYQQATGLDPEFALAWIGELRALYADAQAAKAVTALRKAKALSARLAPREGQYVDAWVSEYDASPLTRDKWISLAQLYPDFVAAQANAAMSLIAENRYKEALPYLERQLAPQNAMASLAYDDLGEAQLGMENYAASAKSFDRAVSLGSSPSVRRRARVDAAQRDFGSAERRLSSSEDDRFFDFEKIAVALDRGDWRTARVLARRVALGSKDSDAFDRRAILVTSGVAEWLAGDAKQAQRLISSSAEEAIGRLSGERDADTIEYAVMAVSAALVAQRMGDDSVVRRVSKALQAQPELNSHPLVADFYALLEANTAMASGKPEVALGILHPRITGSERYEVRVALMEAAQMAGNLPLALEQVRWLQRHRGLAYGQMGCNQCLQALNVAESTMAVLAEAEILLKIGHEKEARQALARFDALWAPDGLNPFLQQRRSALVDGLSKSA